MLESKINQKNTHAAIAASANPFEFDPFEALDEMGDEMRPRTPFPDREGIPFDAEVLYARRAAENNQPPELSRLETKFGKTIVGFLYRDNRERAHLQCDTDGHKSVLQCEVSFSELLTLPNLREPCKVVPIPDTSQFSVTDDPSKPGYIVTPDEGKCGCRLIFNHEYECRHLKAVRQYQVEHVAAFRSKKPVDDVAPSNGSNSDKLGDLVAKHHPTSLAASECNTDDTPVHCAICARKLTNPESRRVQVGPICREKVGRRGESHLRGDIVSEKLIQASKLYKDPKSQKWVISACIQLDAPVPVTVVKQRDTEFWGQKRHCMLVYLSKDNKVHSIYKVGRELKYKRITALSRDTELDQMAWKEAKKYIDNGGKKPRTILL